MNTRKVIGVIGALVLAGIGTALLVAYVNNAEDRALEGEEVVEVFRVSSAIGPGTDAEEIENSIEVERVPKKVRADDAITALEEVDGLVTEVELVPGEQLIRSRFVDPITFQRDIGRVTEIPNGKQEVTISLAPERAGGGTILPGDTVGVFASFEPFDVSSEVPVEIDDGTIIPPNGSSPNTTSVLLHKVMVTNVQLEELPDVEERQGVGDEEDQDVRLAPTGNLLISLAVDTFEAERLVFTAEFGFIWLSIEPDHAVEEPSVIQTRGTVYQTIDELLDFFGNDLVNVGDETSGDAEGDEADG